MTGKKQQSKGACSFGCTERWEFQKWCEMARTSFLEKDWVSVSDYSSGAQILQRSGQLPDRWPRPTTAWPVIPKCLLGCSYLCCSIYVATTRRLVNLKIYHRIAHWITATGKHVLQPKSSSGNSCFFLSLLAVFFPANFFQNKPYIREWCFLSFPVGLTCRSKVTEVNRAHILICPSEENTLSSAADTGGKYCCGYSATQWREFDDRRRMVSLKRNNCSSW